MLLLLTAAALSGTAVETSARVLPDRQARAVVHILRAEPIRFGRPSPASGAVLRHSLVRDRDGSRLPSTLVEFY